MADDTNDTSLTEAYQTVLDAEKAMLEKLKKLLDQFVSDVAAASGGTVAAPMTPARQFLADLQSRVGSYHAMELPNVMARYGMAVPGMAYPTGVAG